jgi:hypothetical protein
VTSADGNRAGSAASATDGATWTPGGRTKHMINPLGRGHIAFRTDEVEAFKRRLTEGRIPLSDRARAMDGSERILFHDPAGDLDRAGRQPRCTGPPFLAAWCRCPGRRPRRAAGATRADSKPSCPLLGHGRMGVEACHVGTTSGHRRRARRVASHRARQGCRLVGAEAAVPSDAIHLRLRIADQLRVPQGRLRIWVYVPVRPDGAPGEGLPGPGAAYPLLQSYIDVVVEGALEYGPDYAREPIETTADWSSYWLNDRELAPAPGSMTANPPPSIGCSPPPALPRRGCRTGCFRRSSPCGG